MHACMQTYKHIHDHAYVYKFIRTYTLTIMNLHTCAYICMCVCVCARSKTPGDTPDVYPYLFFRFSLPCQVLSDCERWAGSRLRVWDAKDIALHVTTARDLLHTCAQGTHVSTPLRNFTTQWRQNRASANQKQKRQERHQTSSCSWFHISFRSTC